MQNIIFNKSFDELDKESFFEIIEKISTSFNLSYIDSVLYFCEKMDVEIDDPSIIKLICPALRSKLEEDAIRLHLIKKRKKTLQ
jgi:hypothetical protein